MNLDESVDHVLVHHDPGGGGGGGGDDSTSVMARHQAWERMEKELQEKSERLTHIEKDFAATIEDLNQSNRFLSKKLEEHTKETHPEL